MGKYWELFQEAVWTGVIDAIVRIDQFMPPRSPWFGLIYSTRMYAWDALGRVEGRIKHRKWQEEWRRDRG